MDLNITSNDIMAKLQKRIGEDALRIASLEVMVSALQEKLAEYEPEDGMEITE